MGYGKHLHDFVVSFSPDFLRLVTFLHLQGCENAISSIQVVDYTDDAVHINHESFVLHEKLHLVLSSTISSDYSPLSCGSYRGSTGFSDDSCDIHIIVNRTILHHRQRGSGWLGNGETSSWDMYGSGLGVTYHHPYC